MFKDDHVDMLFVVVFLAMAISVRSAPRHVSGPDDAHAFRGEDTTLRCRVENVTGFAIVWQFIDGSGQGLVIGKCLMCPMRETCTTMTREAPYSVSRDGNVFELLVHDIKTPVRESLGHYECGYFKVADCASTNTITTGGYILFQSAIIFVYDILRCSTSLVHLNDEILIDRMCTWEPKVYHYAGVDIKTRIKVDNVEVNPDVILPNGVIKRLHTNSSLEQIFQCDMIDSSDVILQSCTFQEVQNQDISISIQPLNVSLHVGMTQLFTCIVQPNTTVGPKWILFKSDSEISEEVTSSRRTFAGDVQFLLHQDYALSLQGLQKHWKYFN